MATKCFYCIEFFASMKLQDGYVDHQSLHQRSGEEEMGEILILGELSL